jgi:hypothetical protein
MAAGSGGSRTLSIFCGVSSVSTRDAEEAENLASEVFIVEEIDGVGKKGSGDSTIVNTETFLETILEDF